MCICVFTLPCVFCVLGYTFSPPFLLSFHYIFPSVSAIFPLHFPLRFCYLSITFFPPFLLSFHYIFSSVSAIFPLHFLLRFCYLSITFFPPFLLSFHYILKLFRQCSSFLLLFFHFIISPCFFDLHTYKPGLYEA